MARKPSKEAASLEEVISPYSPLQAIIDPDRLSALSSLGLETISRKPFARLARLAARLVRSPMALVTVVVPDRQVILGAWGLDDPWSTRNDMPLEYSYCQHALSSPGPFLISDARTDPRVSSSPAIADLKSISYAGIPLRLFGKHTAGTLCVVDKEPREWTEDELSSLQDLTDSAASELALHVEMVQRERHSQRLDTLGKVAAGIAHDFRNILMAINGNADYLLEEMAPHDLLRSEVGQIKLASGRAEELTTRLLEFSRDQPSTRLRVDLNQVVADVVPMFQRLVGRAHPITIRIAGRELETLLNVPEFEQVLLNLVVNARDSMKGGGRIGISTGIVELDAERAVSMKVGPGEFVTVTVRDHGTGISAEAFPKIFDSYFTTKRSGEGTGIGLATCLAIVQDYGGFIEVKTGAERGSRFTAYLPSMKPEAA